MKNDAAYKRMVKDIGDALYGIKDMCRERGIFDGLRELFRCQNCGLLEDVGFDGKLLTYHDIDNPADSGLRFPEPDDEGYSRCPECGAVVRLEEEEFIWKEGE